MQWPRLPNPAAISKPLGPAWEIQLSWTKLNFSILNFTTLYTYFSWLIIDVFREYCSVLNNSKQCSSISKCRAPAQRCYITAPPLTSCGPDAARLHSTQLFNTALNCFLQLCTELLPPIFYHPFSCSFLPPDLIFLFEINFDFFPMSVNFLTPQIPYDDKFEKLSKNSFW